VVQWVTPHADPLMRSGGALRTGHLIRELARDVEVHVLVVGDPPVDESALRKVTGAASARWFPGPGRVGVRALCLRHRWPLSVARMWNPAVTSALRAHPGSVLVAEHPQAALYRPGHPYLLHLHDAEAKRLRELPVSGGPVQRVQGWWERSTFPAWERAVTADPQVRVVTVSALDASALGVSATVVPNGTALQPYRQAPLAGRVLFVGALDYGPNRAGLGWWAEEVWPRLAEGFPRLTVIGRGGASALGTLADHPSLEVVGEVADLEPYYREAAMVVVPLLHGSGTRVKVLEAMAWSVPVLSTAKGAEGLQLVPGRDLLVADTAADFAASARRLVADVGLRRELGSSGRRAVEPYSWAEAGKLLRDLVLSVAVESSAERPSRS